jgi:hypothetical protein
VLNIDAAGVSAFQIPSGFSKGGGFSNGLRARSERMSSAQQPGSFSRPIVRSESLKVFDESLEVVGEVKDRRRNFHAESVILTDRGGMSAAGCGFRSKAITVPL